MLNVLVVLSKAMVIGCSDARDQLPREMVSDSAGVQLLDVSDKAVDESPMWTVDDSPSLVMMDMIASIVQTLQASKHRIRDNCCSR